jgi:integrase/recombinase XerD
MRVDKKPSRKRGQRFHKPVGDPADPDGLFAYMRRYLDFVRAKGFTEQTLWSQERAIRTFIGWCDLRALARPQEITRPMLESYQRYLHYYRQRSGAPLSLRTQKSMIDPVKSFFRWLARNRYLLHNPASELEMVHLPRRLPRHVLTADEAEAVLRQADIATPLGIRDRAILETLYSTGIRRMEIGQLQVHDVDAERGTLLVRQGKGRRDRLVPIGARALYWIDRYQSQVRPQLASEPDDLTLFLTNAGEPFALANLSRNVGRYIDRAQLGKRGGCHLFRHTMATLMLENGADIRYIQAMLGHVALSTTEIYTQVAIRTLKAVHSATHPADARVRPTHAAPDAPANPAALWAALDAEAEGETQDLHTPATGPDR